jgi:hypothetical protein
MKHTHFWLIAVLIVILLLGCSDSNPTLDGDTADGDETDGDVLDGDASDGDSTDGDSSDGDLLDGDEPDGDSIDGDVIDGDLDSEQDIDLESEQEDEPLPDPTYWSAEATQVVNDINFVTVDGKPFFGIGFDTHSGQMYDGVSGPGECDEETGAGFVNYQVEKNQAAAAAGANFAYVWSYGNLAETLVAVDPPFKGIWQGAYGTTPAPEHDVIPIIYNAYGEEDMGNPSAENAQRMANEFAQFESRTGMYSSEAMPSLPPYSELPWYSWHPTYRMIGNGKGEQLDDERATLFAQTTNMMIGDHYTYVENRFDRSTPEGQILAEIYGQKGDVGEGYDEWLEWDDPDHREYFTAAWDLTHSLVTRRNPGAVVWLWLQGYSFGEGLQVSTCIGRSDDAWASGQFPSDRYLRKEVTSVISAGGTGIVFFGWFMDRWPEANRLVAIFSALAHEDIYGPVLTSPRLDIGVDTAYLGEEGYDGLGRVHAIVKWDEASKTAAIVAANPGGRDSTLELTFPWTLDHADLFNWDTPGFEAAPTDVKLWDKTITYVIPKDTGVIIRLHPKMAP